MNDALNQAMMDEVNETTSIFINAFPGAVNLQPNDIQVDHLSQKEMKTCFSIECLEFGTEFT